MLGPAVSSPCKCCFGQELPCKVTSTTMYKATAAAAALPPVQKKLNLFHILINQCEFFIRVQGCFLGTKVLEELSSEPGTETPPPSSAGGVDTVCQVLEIRCDGVPCLCSGPQLGAEGQQFPVPTRLETPVCEWGQQGSRLLSGSLLTGTQTLRPKEGQGEFSLFPNKSVCSAC